MWFNLARYNGYKNTKSAFDFVKKSMAPVDIGKAQEASKICLCQRQFKIDPLIDVIAEVKLTHPSN